MHNMPSTNNERLNAIARDWIANQVADIYKRLVQHNLPTDADLLALVSQEQLVEITGLVTAGAIRRMLAPSHHGLFRDMFVAYVNERENP